MRHWLTLVIASLASFAPAFGRSSVHYTRYELHELCFEAEAIAVGRIVSLDRNTFEVVVTRQIVGAPSPARLRMQRFQNWTCASRWGPYALGQELLLFLRRPEAGAALESMGAGCEGEMPVLGEHVGVPGFCVQNVPFVEALVGSDSIVVQRVPLEEFAQAIVRLREWFLYVDRDHGKCGCIEPLWPMEEVDSFAESSPIARQLVEELRGSCSWHGPEPDDGPQLGPSSTERVQVAGADIGSVNWLTPLADLDEDGIAETLASLDHPDGLALVHVSSTGEVRFEPIQLENIRGKLTFGACAILGDLDRDGRIEFLLHVGEPGLVLASLAAGGRSARRKSLPGLGALRDAGMDDHESLRPALAALGDLDGDGTPEVALSVEHQNPRTLDTVGSVFVASIDRTGAFVRARRWRHPDLPASDWIFRSMAAIGDVDGDGVTDVALGDVSDDLGWRMRGALRIVFLERDGSVNSVTRIGPTSGGLRAGFRWEERLGEQVAAGGDIDGDSIPDVLATSRSGAWILLLARDGSVREHRRLYNPRDFERASEMRQTSPYSPLNLDLLVSVPDDAFGADRLVLARARVTSEGRVGLLALTLARDGTPTVR